MAEQAHFAKYKISLKNNNKESQQVNKPTSQREIESTSRRANRSTSQQVNEDMRVRNSKIRFFENSRIQEFVEVDRQKKEEKSQKFLLPTVIQSLLFILLSIFEHRQPKDWSCCPFSGSKVNCHLRYREQIRFQHTF